MVRLGAGLDLRRLFKICSKRSQGAWQDWYRSNFQNVVFLWVAEAAFILRLLLD